MNEVAILTANFGGVDELHPAVDQTVGVDFWSFGDCADGWNRWPREELMPRLPEVYLAKLPKVLPEMLMASIGKRYLWYIWLDASCHILDERFAEWMVRQTDYWGLFKHSKRNCVMDEVDHSLEWPRYASHPLRAQYEHYTDSGFSDEIGLFECTVMVRRSTMDTRELCSSWMNEIMLWSFQDQISLPFVFWWHGFKPTLLHKTVYTAPHHQYHGHKSYDYTRAERLHADL